MTGASCPKCNALFNRSTDELLGEWEGTYSGHWMLEVGCGQCGHIYNIDTQEGED